MQKRCFGRSIYVAMNDRMHYITNMKKTTAKQFLQVALGRNMNFSTLKPLAIEEIMEQYAKIKIKEEKSSEAK